MKFSDSNRSETKIPSVRKCFSHVRFSLAADRTLSTRTHNPRNPKIENGLGFKHSSKTPFSVTYGKILNIFLNPVRNTRDFDKRIGFQRGTADQSAIDVQLRQKLFRVIDL